MKHFTDSLEAKRYAVSALRKLAKVAKECDIAVWYNDEEGRYHIRVGDWGGILAEEPSDKAVSWGDDLEAAAADIENELHDDCKHEWFFVEDEMNSFKIPTGRKMYKCAICNTIKLTKQPTEGKIK